MSNELVHENGGQLQHALSVENVMAQVGAIQTLMGRAMRKDEHYGVIPGTGIKPSLLKPGAEKLCMMFRLSPSYIIDRRDYPNSHLEFAITCTLTHIQTGAIWGQGVGLCSTMEGKFRFRKAEQICPACGKPTIIRGKKEYGGGWLCYKARGGCGEKFQDGDPEIENQNMGRIEHDNPADYYNTVLKMAKKRAMVDATLTATAASDIFTQDVEDMTEVIPGSSAQTNDEPPTATYRGKQPPRKEPTASEEPCPSFDELQLFQDQIEAVTGSPESAMEWLFNVTDNPDKGFPGIRGVDGIRSHKRLSWLKNQLKKTANG
jgi:hypothetical protein